MDPEDDDTPTESKALQLVRHLLDQAIDGVPPLSSATNLAKEYLLDVSYEDLDERVDALIRWESMKNFTSGFLTGLGGLVTLPVSIPAAIGASWIIQARLCGAIAVIYGHSLEEDKVRTLVLLSILGDAGKEILKDVGIQVGKRVAIGAIDKIPGRVLIEINKKIGFRLLTKFGETGAINLVKLVPLVGGMVGGSFDASMCMGVGHIGKHMFRPEKPPGGEQAAAGVS
jgi:uncharacterized protein (DUF697 family)